MGPPDIIGCFIPECINTSDDPPGKRFARVPCLPKLRQLWVKAGLRLKVKVPMVDKSPMYCCEDHFDLQFDATKQWLTSEEQNERGSFVKLKRGVLPHIFPSRTKPGNTKPLKKRPISESNEEKLSNATSKEEPLNSTDPLKNTDGVLTKAAGLNEVSGKEAKLMVSKDQDEDCVRKQDDNCSEEAETDKAVHKTESDHKKLEKNRSSKYIVEKQKEDHEKEKLPIKSPKSGKESGIKDRNFVELCQKKLTSQLAKDTMDHLPTESRDEEDDPGRNDKIVKTDLIKLGVDLDGCEEGGVVGKAKTSRKSAEAAKGKPSKRKAKDERESTVYSNLSGDILNSTDDSKEQDGNKCKKKRKVVKEILAWIPSSPSVVPQLRASKMQPFIVVQTPPLTPGKGPVPVLQFPSVPKTSTGPSLASVPLTSGKETQFILTVPEKTPSGVGSGNQQLVLAVPQGCSFSVDKIPDLMNDKQDNGSAPTPNPSFASTEIDPSSNIDMIQDSIKRRFDTTSPVTKHHLKPVNMNSNHIKDCTDSTGQDPKTPGAISYSVTRTIRAGDTQSCKSEEAQTSTCSCADTMSASQSTCSFACFKQASDANLNLSKSFQQVIDEFRSMKKAIDSLNKELGLLRVDNAQLKVQNTQLIEQARGNNSIDDETKKLTIAAECLRRWFTPNQVTILLGRPEDKTRVNWTESEMDTSVGLYIISPHAYKYIQSSMKYPLPSVSTLKRYIERRDIQEKYRRLNTFASNMPLNRKEEDNADSLDRGLLHDYNSEEEVELEEGVIRRLELQEKLSERSFNVDKYTGKQNFVNRHSKISENKLEDLKYLSKTIKADKDERVPKVVRVNVQHPIGPKKVLIPKQNKHNISKSSQCHNVSTLLKPKVVQIQRPSDVKFKVNGKNMPSEFKGIKPIVREVVRIKKDITTKDIPMMVPQVTDGNMINNLIDSKTTNEIVLNNTDNSCQRRLSVTSIESLIEKQPHIETNVPNDVLNYNNGPVEELVISHDYQDSTNEHIPQGIVKNESEVTIENVPHILETDDGSKVIRIQVEPLQGEDGTLYEEVVIHCDDATMFDNEVVGLAFSHDDNIEDTAFL